MASTSKKPTGVPTLSKLTLEDPKKTKAKSKSKPKKVVADSWEDEDASSGSESDNSTIGAEDGDKQGVAAPPPTPVSPTYRTTGAFSPNSWPASPPGDSSPSKRPEKTDAVARRMIAGALGVKAPKPTEEQRAYEKAIREQERKRRDAEKAAEKTRQEEAERAKAAVWTD